ncbi:MULTISPECIES: PP2C family protein-serine/threonine phosphatase [Niastella]|uniref:Serine/threonine-protein phosphatase n=1 Tax=Niastella soli TaxID=2821487 RepID=A0ABS3Z152_9BACT|nr:protein phosphatase 2C domain-containing protein [Niastella soli]MBO9203410.1 serine/threonine-protein phosphatase [Niastella soli]
MKTILLSGNTHPGMRRKENEDTFSCHQLWSPDKALLVVIDGVGGYAGGKRAAAIARDSIDQYMQTPKGDTLTMLREAMIFANNRIAEERMQDPKYGEMCCVLTAAVADTAAGLVYFVHVGDTRLYRYRKGELKKLTRDHSFVGLREDAGEITEREAMDHPQRNQILREVGSAIHRIDDEDFMQYGKEELLPGDGLLLCSDGLTDMVTAKQISEVLATSVALNNKVNNIIALANEMGGHDNITVVLLKNNRVKQVAQPANGTRVKKTVKPKSDPKDSTSSPSSNKAIEKPNKTSQSDTAAVKKAGSSNKWLKWNVPVIVLLAASSWFFFSRSNESPTPEQPTQVQEVKAVDDTTHKMGATLFSGQHAAPSGPGSAQTPDTLRLSATSNLVAVQRYADSVGNTILLLPAKEKVNHFAALEINKASAKAGDTLVIRNLRLKGFEVGIKVSIPVHIRLENTFFENVKYPVSNQVKPDSTNKSLSIQVVSTEMQ